MNGQSLSKQASKQARIDYIDLLRAFGIFVMIMGHVAFGGVFDKWIHIFHMPMFFIISGYFYRRQPFTVMLKKRAKTLLLPYFVFGIIHLIIQFIRIGSIDTHAFYLLFWENTAENGIPIAGALWFLTAMFFSEVLFWCVQSIKISEIVRTIIAVAIAIAGMACAVYLPFRLPWAFDVGMVGVGLYQTGRLIKQRWPKVLELNAGFAILGVIIFSALGMLNGYVNLRQGHYGIWPLFWINTVGLTLAFWNFSRGVCSWLEEKNILPKVMTWIKGMGRDSIVFLCLNQLAILFAGDLVNLVISGGGIVILLLKKLMILLITMVELYIAQKVVMGTRLKILIGKW